MKKSKFGSFVLVLGFMIGGAMPVFAQTSDPRGGSFTQADRDLLTRQQIRLDTFEESLKELRGQVELEVKNTRTQMEKLSASVLASTSGASGDAQAIQSELARLNDSITILNQRLSRTIEMSSDIEFRVLRLEKRLSTLLQLSDASISDQIVQDDVSGAGVPADVSLSRDARIATIFITNFSSNQRTVNSATTNNFSMVGIGYSGSKLSNATSQGLNFNSGSKLTIDAEL